MLIEIDDSLIIEYRQEEEFSESMCSDKELITLLIKKYLIQSGVESHKYHILLKTFYTKYKFLRDVKYQLFKNKCSMFQLQFSNLKYFLDMYGSDVYEQLLLDIETQIRYLFPKNTGYILNLNFDRLDIGIILSENDLSDCHLNISDKINVKFCVLDLDKLNLKELVYQDMEGSITFRNDR